MHRELPAGLLDSTTALAHATEQWDRDIVKQLTEYIAIPNKSPSFKPDWEQLGHMDRAVDLFVAWAEPRLGALDAKLSVERLPGRTPLIFIDVPGTAHGNDTVLLYGHLDKQPEMTGCSEGKGPWIFPCSKATSSTDAAAPMTAMRCSARWRRSLR